ncbi:MAG: M28 family peptidase [Flavobacteriales bacterium]
MRFRLVALGLLLSLGLSAQELPSVKQTARAYVDTLAGPAMHGRGYVLSGDRIAGDWMAKQFDRIGLERLNGQRFEAFSFPVNTFPDSVKVMVDGKVLKPGVDFIVDPASGPSDGTFDLVHVNLADLTDPVKRSRTMGAIAGHAVLLRFPETHNVDSLQLFDELQAQLSRYAPVIRQGGEKLTWSVAGEHAGHAIIEVKAGTIPDTAHTVTLHVADVFVPKHNARNVLGVVKAKGSSKDWVVVTAHYDHLGMMGPDALFPGANDNASGSSMLLCLAQWAKEHPQKFNILFIAFAGEEAGLKGSECFVVDHPLDLKRIKLLINLDLNGTGDDGITMVNADSQKKVYDKLVAINESTHRFPVVKARGAACNSDHCPFTQAGVPAVFIYTMGGVSYYHDVMDRPMTLPLTKFDELYRTLAEVIASLK